MPLAVLTNFSTYILNISKHRSQLKLCSSLISIFLHKIILNVINIKFKFLSQPASTDNDCPHFIVWFRSLKTWQTCPEKWLNRQRDEAVDRKDKHGDNPIYSVLWSSDNLVENRHMECRNSKPPVKHSAENLNLMNTYHDTVLTKITRMSKQYSVGRLFCFCASDQRHTKCLYMGKGKNDINFNVSTPKLARGDGL